MQAQTHDEHHEAPPQTIPRFRVEKLEERIAPTHKAGHYPPGQGGYYDPPPKWDWCYGGHKGGSHTCKP